MDDPVLRLVGLARRARRVVLGREACKRAARAGTLHAIVVACDAGSSAARDAGAGPGIEVAVAAVDKQGLGAVVGRPALAVLGITDPGLAAGIATAVARRSNGEGRDASRRAGEGRRR